MFVHANNFTLLLHPHILRRFADAALGYAMTETHNYLPQTQDPIVCDKMYKVTLDRSLNHVFVFLHPLCYTNYMSQKRCKRCSAEHPSFSQTNNKGIELYAA